MSKLVLIGRTSGNRFASLAGPVLLIGRTSANRFAGQMFSFGRTSENRFASLAGPMLLVVALALAVTACGVKNDLNKPNGQSTPRGEPDPSRPPYPLGR